MKFDQELFAKHLAGMVRIPTVSSADPEKTRVEEFRKLHAYLEEAYPLVHQTLKREIVGKCALLYTWKGTGKSSSLPLLMTAHQDVVPEGDHAMWKYPPYSARIDEEGIMWGRGTTDSKCNIQAYMDAIELLIADGFTPDYDLYLAFGYNEEIMGGPGAAGKILHDELAARGIQLGMAIDECGGISEKEDGTRVAEIYVSEKGYADHEFYIDDPGGHSAYPPVHTALGRIGKAIYDLENSRKAPKMTDVVVQEMQARAPFVSEERRALYEDPRAHEAELLALAETEKEFNQMFRTTTAPTMAKGSDQANILPEHASVITNSRILPTETLEELEAHFASVIPEEVHFRLIKGHNPPAVSSTESEGYRLLEQITKEMYPGVTMIPCMMAGGTDSRWYCDLSPTKSVYRYTGLLWNKRSGGAHSVNEHIDTAILPENVRFYTELFTRYGR